ncbi:MAG: SDR family oxidoreductase [Sphingomonadales bacterium]|nr:MAG: SDR family oxidoreductase [Sphingomonadales bacterium]
MRSTVLVSAPDSGEVRVGYWIVTGGASGIGLQLVRDLIGRGHDVRIWDIKAPPELAGASFDQVDLTDAAAIAAAAARIDGEVDCFIHNAGVFQRTSIAHDNLAATVDLAMKVHYVAFVLATQALLAKFSARASIVAITSAAMDMVYPGTLAYGPSKAALDRAIRQLAVELGPRGIRVNGIAPGSIATDMTKFMWDDPDYARERLSHIPLGVQSEPAVIAEAISYLASDAARYTTGDTLWIDGGVKQGIFLSAVRALVDEGERA